MNVLPFAVGLLTGVVASATVIYAFVDGGCRRELRRRFAEVVAKLPTVVARWLAGARKASGATCREVGVWWIFVVKQILVWAPFGVAGWMIWTYTGQDDAFLRALNGTGPNQYPMAAAGLVLVLAALAGLYISLGFYFYEVWKNIRKGLSGVSGLLAVLVMWSSPWIPILFSAFFVFAVYITPEREWAPHLFAGARLCTLGAFVLFALGDGALYLIFSRVSPDDSQEAKKARHSKSLAGLSVLLIDVPMIAITLAGWALKTCLETNVAYHKARSLTFPLHNIMVDLPPEATKIGVYGVEAGVLVTSIVVSQMVFGVLVARWVRATSRLGSASKTMAVPQAAAAAPGSLPSP